MREVSDPEAGITEGGVNMSKDLSVRVDGKSLLIGVVTVFVGLVVIVPLIGYAAWHGYLETIDADQFPRHEVGITSVPRPD